MSFWPWKKKPEQRISSIVQSAIDEWELTTRQCTALVQATDPVEIAELEAKSGITQQNAVVHFLEQTEWALTPFRSIKIVKVRSKGG